MPTYQDYTRGYTREWSPEATRRSVLLRLLLLLLPCTVCACVRLLALGGTLIARQTSQ